MATQLNSTAEQETVNPYLDRQAAFDVIYKLENDVKGLEGFISILFDVSTSDHLTERQSNGLHCIAMALNRHHMSIADAWQKLYDGLHPHKHTQKQAA